MDNTRSSGTEFIQTQLVDRQAHLASPAVTSERTSISMMTW